MKYAGMVLYVLILFWGNSFASVSGVSQSRFSLPCARYKARQVKKHESCIAASSWDEVILSYLRREYCIPELYRAVKLCLRNPHIAWAVLRAGDKQIIHSRYCDTSCLEAIPEDGEPTSVDYHFYFLRHDVCESLASSEERVRCSEKLSEIAALVVACITKHFPHIAWRCIKEAACVSAVPASAFLSAYVIYLYSDSLMLPPTTQWALWGIM